MRSFYGAKNQCTFSSRIFGAASGYSGVNSTQIDSDPGCSFKKSAIETYTQNLKPDREKDLVYTCTWIKGSTVAINKTYLLELCPSTCESFFFVGACIIACHDFHIGRRLNCSQSTTQWTDTHRIVKVISTSSQRSMCFTQIIWYSSGG